jgi:hypothetical protein
VVVVVVVVPWVFLAFSSADLTSSWVLEPLVVEQA